MPKIRNPYTDKMIKVSSKVKVGKPSSTRQRSYCSRSGKIRGNWKRNPNSKNLSARRRWKCPYLPGELRL